MRFHLPVCFIFTIGCLSYSLGQTMMRQLTLEDMDQLSTRMMGWDFGDKINMSNAKLVGGTLQTVKNIIKYVTTVKAENSVCVVVSVVDGLSGTTINTKRDCNKKVSVDETEQLILLLIQQCERIHREASNDYEDYTTVMKLLQLTLEHYRSSGNILVFERHMFKFNLFSQYGIIIRKLLENMRTVYDRSNQLYYVKNIEFILSITDIVELLGKQRVSEEEYSSVRAIITRIMEVYHRNERLDDVSKQLRILNSPRLQIIILPLIQILSEPPPTKIEPQDVDHSGIDSFESALRQLVTSLQGRKNGRYMVVLIQFINKVLTEYLTNLYVLPEIELPKELKLGLLVEKYMVSLNRFLLLLQRQYNEQHNTVETAKYFRLSQIIELLRHISMQVPDGMNDAFKKLADSSIEIVWGDRPIATRSKNFDQLTRILEILKKLDQHHKNPAVKQESDLSSEEITPPKHTLVTQISVLYEFVVKILESIRNHDVEQLVDLEVPSLEGYETITREIAKIITELNPNHATKPKDEFISKIINTISQLKDNRKRVCNPKCSSNGYEQLMEILKFVQRDYHKNKMLRIFSIEELKLHEVYLEYSEVFYSLIKSLEFQYIKQKHYSEVTKCIWILQLEKLLVEVEKHLKQDVELLKVKAILVQIMKDVYDKKKMATNYIVQLTQLKEENEVLTRLVIRLMTIIINMPQQIQPIVKDEDYFEKEIRVLITLLTKIFEEGKSPVGFKETMQLLQFVVGTYRQTNKRLPGFKFEDLKLEIVHLDYQKIVDRLMQLMEKKYVEQHQNEELMKLIYVAQVRELFVKLTVLAERGDGSKGSSKIKIVLRKIMVDLYTNGKLEKDYETILLVYQTEYEMYKDFITQIITYLKSWPKATNNTKGSGKRGTSVDMIEAIITDLNKMKDRYDQNLGSLIQYFERIIGAIKSNNNKLPPLMDLQFKMEVYLKSGLYDDVLQKFIRDLMSRYSIENNLKDVSVLVKIGFLLDYIGQCKKLRDNLGTDAGFDEAFSLLIVMVDNLLSNAEFTKDYTKEWRALQVRLVEYKNIVALVIELLRQGCAICDFRPPTTTPRPTSEIGVTEFEIYIQVVRKIIYRLRHNEGRPRNGYEKINGWLNTIEQLFFANGKNIPVIKEISVKFYEQVKGYDEAIRKLIEALMKQYRAQKAEEEARKMQFVIELRLYISELTLQYNQNIREGKRIYKLLALIISRIISGQKLKENIFTELEKRRPSANYQTFIVRIIRTLKTLPVAYWAVAVARDDFERDMRQSIAVVGHIFQRGASKEIYDELVSGCNQLMNIYQTNGRTLPLGLRIQFKHIYQLTLQYSEVWRKMVLSVMAQYRRQNANIEIRRYDFALRMQLFLRQIVVLSPQINPGTYTQIVELIVNLFNDFNRGVMRIDYKKRLLDYLKFHALRQVLPNVIYYLTNFNGRFVWIEGTRQQISSVGTLKRTIRRVYRKKTFIIRQIYSVWNGNMACGAGCANI